LPSEQQKQYYEQRDEQAVVAYDGIAIANCAGGVDGRGDVEAGACEVDAMDISGGAGR